MTTASHEDSMSFRSASPALSHAPTAANSGENSAKSAEKPTLFALLSAAELAGYYAPLTSSLKIRHVDHLKFVKDSDLLEIGMSKPEIRRLWKFHHKLCQHDAGLFDKLKSMSFLGRKGSFSKKKDASKASGADPLAVSADEQPSATQQQQVSPGKLANQQHHIIPARNMTLCKQLGSGEFGSVWQAVWSLDNGHKTQVAVKVVDAGKMPNNPLAFIHEAAVMHKIRHDNIVKLYGVVLETSTIMLVTELAPLRSLHECLRDESLRSSFPLDRLCGFAEQICAGMCYLEQNRFIHRDLAARNILVFSKDLVKICDFGLSKSLRVDEDYYRGNLSSSLRLPIAWCAPECINQLKFTSASDVWAYAVTLWEMFTYGFQPWAGLTGHQILEQIDLPRAAHLEVPDLCPSDYYQLMLQCWQHQPSSRPRFEHIDAVLPTIRPERVLAVTAGDDGQPDHLQYPVNSIITVINKRPLAYPDGYYWKGVLPGGRTGLFLPTNTVAYIGIEYPSVPANFKSSIQSSGATVRSTESPPTGSLSAREPMRPPVKSASTSSGGKSRLFGAGPSNASNSSTPNQSRGPSAEKSLISGPIGPPRHTAHYGIDGACFGDLVSVDSKPRNVVAPMRNASEDQVVVPPTSHAPTPPPTPHPQQQHQQQQQSHTTTNGALYSRPQRSSVDRENRRMNSADSRESQPSKQPVSSSIDSAVGSASDTTGMTSLSCRDTSFGGTSLLDDVFGALNMLDGGGAQQQQKETVDKPEPISGNANDSGVADASPTKSVTLTMRPVGSVRPLSFGDGRKLDRWQHVADKHSDKQLDRSATGRHSMAIHSPSSGGSPAGIMDELRDKFRSLTGGGGGSTGSSPSGPPDDAEDETPIAPVRDERPLTVAESDAYNSWIGADTNGHQTNNHNAQTQNSTSAARSFSFNRKKTSSPPGDYHLDAGPPDQVAPVPPPKSTTTTHHAHPAKPPPPVPVKRQKPPPPTPRQKPQLQISSPILDVESEERMISQMATAAASPMHSPTVNEHADSMSITSVAGSAAMVRSGIWAPTADEDEYDSSPLRAIHTDANKGVARMFKPPGSARRPKFNSPPKTIQQPIINTPADTNAQHSSTLAQQSSALEQQSQLNESLMAQFDDLKKELSLDVTPPKSASPSCAGPTSNGSSSQKSQRSPVPPPIAPKPKFGQNAPHPLLKKREVAAVEEYDDEDEHKSDVNMTSTNVTMTSPSRRNDPRYQTAIDKYELLDFVLQPLNDKQYRDGFSQPPASTAPADREVTPIEVVDFDEQPISV